MVLGQPPLLFENPGFDQYFNPKAFVVPPTVPDFRGPGSQPGLLRDQGVPRHRGVGKLTGSQTVGRQIQFGLKLLW